MNDTVIRYFTAATAVLFAASIAACSSGGGSAPAAPPTDSSGTAATIGVANNSRLGQILVDSQGRTAYLFQQDTGTTSTCMGACATLWPPIVVSGAPAAGTGTTASLIGTTTRSDGRTQITYNGHPLYLYSADSAAGDANGQGITAFGGAWFTLTSAGVMATGSAASPSAGLGY
jgi:predicted lipoprotein with Yx(FWY)xxD motif